jgi:hypothetical protein
MDINKNIRNPYHLLTIMSERNSWKLKFKNRFLNSRPSHHHDLVKAIIFLPEYAPKASVALSNSVQIWDKCVLVTEQISPALSPSSSME